MSATKLQRAQQAIDEKIADAEAGEGAGATPWHFADSPLVLKVLDQEPPDISPWLETCLPSPPANSREDLALRLHNRESQLAAASKRNAELQEELRGLHARIFDVLFPLSHTVAPPPPQPPLPPTDLDSAGAPYDPRLHASNRAKKIDGTWKMRRDLSPYVVTALNNFAVRYPRPAPKVISFRDLMHKITVNVQAKKFTAAQVTSALSAIGLKPDELTALIDDEPRRKLLDERIDEILVPAPPPAPAANCGHCGVAFKPTKNQRWHARDGRRVYCSGPCRVAVAESRKVAS